jgi:DNA-binding NtrC family response regulator
MEDAHQPVSIVVIDDNATSLEFVAEALARSGLRILTSTVPEEGLAMVNAHHPTIVLTDVIMPYISGFDVLRLVKQLDSAIEVVLMSADDLPTMGPNSESSAAGFLRKPIPIAQLRECVARLLEKHEASSPRS